MSERPISNMKIVFDLETFGGTHQPTRDDVSVPKNYKNADTIKAYIDAELPGLYNKQALDSLKGEIVCIGVAKDNEPIEVLYRNLSEEDLMNQFNAWLVEQGVDEFTQVYWVGGGIAHFDLPWILHRAWKYKFPIPRS